jgi:hypothetical protein
MESFSVKDKFKKIRIQDNEFIDCFRAIGMNGVDYEEITGNTITRNNNRSSTFGIYLDGNT